MIKIMTLTLLILFFSGCSLLSTVPKHKVEKGGTIGYLIDIPEYPSILKDDIAKEYPYKWYLEDFVENKLHEKLQKGRYKFINLNDHNFTKEELSDIFDYDREKRKYYPKLSKQEVYEKLNNLGIKGVISLYNKPRNFVHGCTAIIGCFTVEIHKYGIWYKHSLLYIPVNTFYVEAYTVNPNSEYTFQIEHKHKADSVYLKSPLYTAEGFKEPKDINNWTEEEMEPARKLIEQYLQNVLQTTADLLIKKE